MNCVGGDIRDMMQHQQHHPVSAPHCVTSEGCLVSSGGLQYPTDYSGAQAMVGSVDPYNTIHHHTAPGDFGGSGPSPATAAMYVNWSPDQQASHHPGQVFYESYPGAAAAAAMYGYPGGHHMIPTGQENTFPGMSPSQLSESGKRKRRRVISYDQRKAANVRERKRMCHLNDAFDVLRKRVPTFAYEKKLSRIETLKLAVTYIQYMGELLDDIDDKHEGSTGGQSEHSSTDKSSEHSPSSSSTTSSSCRTSTEKPDHHEFRSDDDSTSPCSAD